LPRTIASGETCHFNISIDLATFPDEGTVAQSFDASFSGYRNPLRGTLAVKTTLPLPKVIDLGAFTSFTTKSIELREFAQKSGLQLSGIAASDPRLHVSVLTPTTFTIAVDSMPPGEAIEAFADVTFHGGFMQRVSIRGMASGGLLVHPNPLVFGYVRISHGPLTREVHIDSQDGKPFSLGAGFFDQERFSIKTIAISDTRTICHITVHPQEPGALDEVVKLMTSDGQRGVSIRCVGMVQ
jgi:hypothetical protein